MSQIVRTLTVIPLEAAADHSAKEGYFVELALGKASVCNAATDVPFGLILDGENTGGNDSVAVCGGNAGSVRVKATAAVTKGTFGQLAADGSVIADSGAGARVLPCLFLEDGAANELVEAILVLPLSKS